jgi:hypothetical protein
MSRLSSVGLEAIMTAYRLWLPWGVGVACSNPATPIGFPDQKTWHPERLARTDPVIANRIPCLAFVLPFARAGCLGVTR